MFFTLCYTQCELKNKILDIRHLNRNAFAGIYADPYNWKGEQIKFQNQNHEECKFFVEQNFEIVAHT